ncbi:MAG: ATP-dependent Clp protease proteolytic subunit, partial [Oerskovia sp.]|nr:ATP-dependent Clp protease proteolytic subunit [Oerskovia sp.]
MSYASQESQYISTAQRLAGAGAGGGIALPHGAPSSRYVL